MANAEDITDNELRSMFVGELTNSHYLGQFEELINHPWLFKVEPEGPLRRQNVYDPETKQTYVVDWDESLLHQSLNTSMRNMAVFISLDKFVQHNTELFKPVISENTGEPTVLPMVRDAAEHARQAGIKHLIGPKTSSDDIPTRLSERGVVTKLSDQGMYLAISPTYEGDPVHDLIPDGEKLYVLFIPDIKQRAIIAGVLVFGAKGSSLSNVQSHYELNMALSGVTNYATPPLNSNVIQQVLVLVRGFMEMNRSVPIEEITFNPQEPSSSSPPLGA